MYKIKVTYDTGSSFGHEYGLEAYLNYEWKDLDRAKESLKRIHDHYEAYVLIDRLKWLTETELSKKMGDIKKEPWFTRGDSKYWKWNVTLLGDDGPFVHSTGIWCGYFESLVGAEIVDESMRSEYDRQEVE